ncbi:MAG: polyprenyl synthetase family protein [Desulfamplus sp.]|nr:polyprenyl synthetase family protein [Desulfamplus sp.]
MIISKVGDDLANIERALHDNLTPHLDLVSEIAGHLLFSGGKRLRPLLMVLSAKLCNYNEDFAVKFSTIFEYLHAATLLHDDVVDKACVRRGKPAAHSYWSVPKVVLTGDFLLARSLSLAAQTGIPEIIDIMANITEEMSQGEIEQMEQKGRVDLTESKYLKIIERKTAILIQGACKSGAIVAHKNNRSFNVSSDPYKKELFNKKEEALAKYGYHLGIAFQMADDLLDYTGDVTALGKNPGADIKEGKLTLPLIYSLSKADDEDRALMEDIINNCIQDQDNRADSEGWFNLILDKIDKYQGIKYTELQAQNHVKEAKKSLAMFDDCEAKDILMMVADYSITRKV